MVEQLKPTEDDMKVFLEKMDKQEVSSDDMRDFTNKVDGTTQSWDMIIRQNMDRIKKLRDLEKDMAEFARDKELNVGFLKDWTSNLREQFETVMESFIYQQYVLRLLQIHLGKHQKIFERFRGTDLELKRMELADENVEKIMQRQAMAYEKALAFLTGQTTEIKKNVENTSSKESSSKKNDSKDW